MLRNYRLDIGDILFSHINSDPHLGKTAVYTGYPSVLLHGMNLLRIKPDPQQVLPSFLNCIFKWYRSNGVFIRIAQRAIGQSSISQTKLKNLEIPLPPLSEQRRIVAYLDKVQAQVTELKKAQEATEAELHRLEQAILDKAFRGEL
ncbi:restriction endonuclease subunit S [Candidatus Bipolaricaulota sp. J31]